MRGWLIALLVYSAGTVLAFGPAISGIAGSIGPDLGDPLFNLYVLKWGSHEISRGLHGLWSPPFFAPTPHVLTLSDHLLGPAAEFLALRVLGVPPVAAYNLLLLSTFVLSGWTASWVLHRSGVSWSGSLAGGWVFAFLPFRLDGIGHFQVVRMQWIPLTLWTFDRLLARPSWGRALAFLVFYSLHVSGGAYLAYLVHIPLAVLVVNRCWAEPDRFRAARSWAVWVPTAVAALGVLAVFYAAYLAPESTLNAGHAPGEIRRHGSLLASLLPRAALRLFPNTLAREAHLFPGVAAVILAAVGLRRGWRRFARPASEGRRPVTGGVLVVAGAAVAVVGLLLGDQFTLTGISPVASLSGESLAGYVPSLLVTISGGVVCLMGVRIAHGKLLRWAAMPAFSRGLVVSGVVMLVLCLPAFFWLVSIVLPGMGTMRVSGRAFAFVALPVAYAAGVGWDHLLSNGRRPGRLALAWIVLILVFETWRWTPAGPRVPEEADFPAYARWVGEHAEVRTYLELPLGRLPFHEAVPMYLQTLHWRPLANGYSARLPQSFQELRTLCHPFPGPDGIEALRKRGITHIVVHWEPLSWHPDPVVHRRVTRGREAFERTLRACPAPRVFGSSEVEIFDIRSCGTSFAAEAAPGPS
jgi:hypothetical protein